MNPPVTTPRWIERLLAKLADAKAAVSGMGGDKEIAKQHARGKLTVRERIEIFFDPGTFVELGALVRSQIQDFGMNMRDTPADGVVTGHGKVNGREVCVYATDFTILAGSAGEAHSAKIASIIELAGRMRVPIVGMLDSAGARLHEGSALSRPFNRIFIGQSIYSGVIPQIQMLLGPCAAGQGYSPMLSDFLIMTEKTAYMWLGGPRLTRAATGENIDDAVVGSALSNMKSGQCDLIAADDEAAIAAAKRLLDYLPQHWGEQAPVAECDDPANRRDEQLLDVLPASSRMTYDMHEIVERIVDRESFLELKPDFAPNIITGLARLSGRVVGIIANNPDEMGGVMENDCSDKYMRLMTFCDAFNIPIVTFVDTPGFVVGRDWEDKGILRHGAKLLYAYASATVPKISVIIRRSYGGGNVVMGSKTMGADFSFAWPTAEISIMGPESAASVIWAQELKESKESTDGATILEAKCNEYREKYIDIFKLAENYRFDFVDDIIDPCDTRAVLIRALDALRNKNVDLPKRKHGNPPQ
ncbi:MAG TPA: acyl-CoA carboxylase subunit beta [Candidatus Acidoferrales bacterium]|nr:acyl-CoA carboxylase subunit beta [Candidatus Acidoferrales bacterium]